MDQTTKIAEDVKLLADEMGKKVAELRRAFEQARATPVSPEELAHALEELAGADDDSAFNFRNWPRKGPDEEELGPYAGSAECEEHWHKVCQRKDRAVGALIKFAKAARPAKEA
jgi:hypothetical protein